MKWLIAIVLATSTWICAGCNQEGSSSTATAGKGDVVLTVEKKRDWAARLRNDGLDDQAVVVYEEILADGADLTPSLVSGISVVIAEIHIAKRRYEDALRSLYRARLFDLKGDLAAKVDSKVIFCFERLGRSGVADRILDRATDLGEKGESSSVGDEILAEVGAEKITRSELDGVIAASPPEMQAQLDDPEKRFELLQTLVAQRVMVRKAEKLELDKDPKVRFAVEAAKREILVRKLMADELRGKVEVTDADAKLFYEANRDRFREPGELEIAQIVVADAEVEKSVRAELASGTPFERLAGSFSSDEATRDRGGRVEERFVEGGYHAAFVNVGDVFAAVGVTPAGEVAPKAVRSAAGLHLIKVLDRKDGVQYSFEDAAEAAGRALRAEREQAAVKEMFEKAVTSSDVKIFKERL